MREALPQHTANCCAGAPLEQLHFALSCAQIQMRRPGSLQVAFSSFTTVGPVMAIAIAGDCLEEGVTPVSV